MKRGNFQRTKIVATVGPSCNTYEGLKSLINAGVDVFRLNFSHGTHEGHLQVIKHIVALNEEMNTHVSILADLQGPKLRVGKFAEGKVDITPGEILNFTTVEGVCTKERIYMSY